MINAILFDLDNTLMDFMTMKTKSCEAAVDAMVDAGLKVDKKRGMEILFELYGEKGIEYDRIFQEFLKKTIKKVDYRILAEGIVAYRKAQMAYVKPYPGAVKTLIKLREMGMKLGIVSDAPSVNAWIRLVEMNLENLFDVVVTLHDTGERKPSKAPFMKAIEEIGVNPENILFVGDWPERDIAGAKSVGMKTAFAKYGSDKKIRSGDADYVLENVAGILSILKD